MSALPILLRNQLLWSAYLIWSFTNPEKLPQWAADLLVSDESEVFFSQASLWEISIKFNSGKLVLKGMTPEELYEEIEMSHFQCLPLLNEELISFHRLPIEHRDPFDRIMIWQCISQNIHFLSVDGAAPNYEKHGLMIADRK
jgi:PIN domain nuclease of toxin-antitoxin system